MPPNGAYSSFRVAKSDLRRWQWEERDDPGGGALGPGQVLVAIRRFAFSANNVTYARLGEQIAYWRFFPAAHSWGTSPCGAWAMSSAPATRRFARASASMATSPW
jgi:uncharacterized protein DUF2855